MSPLIDEHEHPPGITQVWLRRHLADQGRMVVLPVRTDRTT
jgi:hypothetical protein